MVTAMEHQLWWERSRRQQVWAKGGTQMAEAVVQLVAFGDRDGDSLPGGNRTSRRGASTQLPQAVADAPQHVPAISSRTDAHGTAELVHVPLPSYARPSGSPHLLCTPPRLPCPGGGGLQGAAGGCARGAGRGRRAVGRGGAAAGGAGGGGGQAAPSRGRAAQGECRSVQWSMEQTSVGAYRHLRVPASRKKKE